jgi:hypothetical protein
MVDLPPLAFRAAIGTVDKEARTVELIWSTGAPVTRVNPWTGERWVEKLSMNPMHVRLERLNEGASLLDSHSAYSVTRVLGGVVPGSARIEKGKGFALVKFSRRPDADAVFTDVIDGVVRHVSTGYQTHKVEEQAGKGEKLPVRTAVDWEPFELSMVPLPADRGAHVRAEDLKALGHRCLVTSIITDADRNRALTFARLRS